MKDLRLQAVRKAAIYSAIVEIRGCEQGEPLAHTSSNQVMEVL